MKLLSLFLVLAMLALESQSAEPDQAESRLREAMSWQDLLLATSIVENNLKDSLFLDTKLLKEYRDWRGDWLIRVRFVEDDPGAASQALQDATVSALRRAGFTAEGGGECAWDSRIAETSLMIEVETRIQQRKHPAQRSMQIRELIPVLHAYRCRGYEKGGAENREYFSLDLDPIKVAGKDNSTLEQKLIAKIRSEKMAEKLNMACRRAGL